MEDEKQEQTEQDKPVDVSLADEKPRVKKCCDECDFSRCLNVLLGRIRGFFTRFSLGCSSTNCVALHTQKTVAQKVEEKKEAPEEKEKNVV